MGTGLRVLVVDDSDVIRRRLVETLSPIAGVAAIEDADGPDAARRLMRRCPIDLVVLDIRMPGGSGIDLLSEIKQAPPSPVVVMLTNYALEPYQEACRRAGADGFLDKSMGIKSLVGIIEAQAARHAAALDQESRS